MLRLAAGRCGARGLRVPGRRRTRGHRLPPFRARRLRRGGFRWPLAAARRQRSRRRVVHRTVERGSLRHGHGRLVGEDGSVFEGSFFDGEFCGEGVFRSPPGHRYEGQWLHGKRHGQGVYRHASGARFEGSWRGGLKEGPGAEHYADGSVYSGEYAQGLKHGRGRYEYASQGVSYSGQFVADALHGEGTYTFSDGRVYAGQWRDGHISAAPAG
ncbi:unnamed protein product [Prorocentrum cordatum]|uniref:MORN repeat-containing protein 5 n=1 Tax=Prorocentrum cordatum TaxID=2364126 RepID=A0ABN9YF83_9DINO|nr:unnamed protein product [Polarella glacialis]